ncbi:hypothetical protein G7046_g3721 [Stylonectria norvegica]|nr:hypothetical protein G7046_g3721 [Stylonectria norvegica]
MSSFSSEKKERHTVSTEDVFLNFFGPSTLGNITSSEPILESFRIGVVPPPDILTLKDLDSDTGFVIWKGEMLSYIKILGFCTRKSPVAVETPSPTENEVLAQAYLLRRLLSVDVKELLLAAKTDMNDPIDITAQLEINRKAFAVERYKLARFREDFRSGKISK